MINEQKTMLQLNNYPLSATTGVSSNPPLCHKPLVEDKHHNTSQSKEVIYGSNYDDQQATSTAQIDSGSYKSCCCCIIRNIHGFNTIIDDTVYNYNIAP